MTRSTKHRTTSNSGNSEKSKKTARSPRAAKSSASATSSFEAIFGKNPSAEQLQAANLLKAYQQRLAAHRAMPEPKNDFMRSRYRQRLARLQKTVRDLTNYLEDPD